MLVAEKKGIIRFFGTHSYQNLFYIETNLYPLLSADWSYLQQDFVGAAAGNSALVLNPKVGR